MISFALLGLALLAAIADWIAVARGWRIAEYILKPAVMVVILVWLVLNGGFSGWMAWFGLGILFSLAGDILLMLPREQFIGGLVAFLFAHIAYVIGLNQTLPPFNLTILILALAMSLTSFQVFRSIISGMHAENRAKLYFPFLLYTIVISLMAFSALLTLVRPEWLPAPAIMVSAGALLFYLSDTLLACNRFVSPIKHGRLANIAPYQIGQILIILGAWLHYH